MSTFRYTPKAIARAKEQRRPLVFISIDTRHCRPEECLESMDYSGASTAERVEQLQQLILSWLEETNAQREAETTR